MKRFLLALFVWALSMTLAVYGQSVEVELSFAPSMFELTAEQEDSLRSYVACGYVAVTITGHADALPNLTTGMSNESLAQYRAVYVNVLLSAGAYTTWSVSGKRSVVVTFMKSQVFADTDISSVEHNTLSNPITFDTVTGISLPYVGEVTISGSTVHATDSQVVASTIDTSFDAQRAAYLSSFTGYDSVFAQYQVNVSPKQAEYTSVYALRLADHVEAERMHGVSRLATYHEAEEFRDSIWQNRRNIIRKGNYAYRMWVYYDAKRSHKEGRPGAVFENGGGYHTLSWWGVNGRKHRNEIITKHGREIPFLGWDKREYEEYYNTHSVFPVDDDNDATASKGTPKAMSYTGYQQPGSMMKLYVKKARRKASYITRAITACRAAARKLLGR